MSRARAILALGWSLAALTPLTVFSVGCSAGASGARSIDDAGGAARDAAGADTGPSVDAGFPGPNSDGGAGAGPEGDRSSPAAFAAACLDGVDDNHADGTDCLDPSCADAPSCCVGLGTSACCTAPLPGLDRVYACATAPCDDLAGATTFGNAGPVRASDMGFVPESDRGDTDSGAILAETFDPRTARLTLHATMAIPSSTLEIDAVAFGLGDAVASALVRPVVALVASAARREIVLVVDGNEAGRAEATVDETFHDYAIAIGPDGHVTTMLDGAPLLEADAALPDHPLHPMFYGRATNPGSVTSPARIGALHVTATACDVPSASTRLGALTIVDHTGLIDVAHASGPHAVVVAGTTFLAFAAPQVGNITATALYVAAREADGDFHVRATPSAPQPVLAPAVGEALRDPALLDQGDTFSLFATRVAASGVRSLVHASGGAAHSLAFAAPTDLSVTGLDGQLDAPAPLPAATGATLQRVVARHTPASGPTELVMLTLPVDADITTGAFAADTAVCGAECTDGMRDQRLIHAARTGTVAFDADEVAAPAVVLVNDVYRVYYAGRHGGRWEIGMLIAADPGYWRAAHGGTPVFSPSGTGFDAISVMDPAPVVENGRLTLYYAASDGAVTQLGVAAGQLVP